MDEIPDRMFFRIGEVAQIVGVEAHVLRYWESEFGEIKPVRSNKQRLYRKKDVELLLRIKRLLHEEGFTISGAKKQVRSKEPEQVRFDFSEEAFKRVLREIRKELCDIKKLLDSPKR